MIDEDEVLRPLVSGELRIHNFQLIVVVTNVPKAVRDGFLQSLLLGTAFSFRGFDLFMFCSS